MFHLLYFFVFKSPHFDAFDSFCLLITDGWMKIIQFVFFQLAMFNATVSLNANGYIMSFVVTGFGVVYSLCREILQTASLKNTTEFISTFTSFWNILDWMTIIMVIATIFVLNKNILEKKDDPYTEILLGKIDLSDYVSSRISKLYSVELDMILDTLEDSLKIDTVSNFVYALAATALVMQALHFIVYFRLINEHLAVSVVTITQVRLFNFSDINISLS